MNEIFEEIYESILGGDNPGAQAAVKQALASGYSAQEILNDALIPAMDEVGKQYECGEFYLAEMLVAAKAMQASVALLRPFLREANVESSGKVIIGTVKGDLHDIGKNLVAMILEGAGFEVIDLGTDVSPQRFAAAVQENSPHIVALSALLTTTMSNMKATVDALTAAGVRNQVKVMIGGAPVNDDYALHIGADGYTPDASQAAALARSLVVAG
jgi:5-methyltetrahydrofolate--homocysteine methyltransferase